MPASRERARPGHGSPRLRSRSGEARRGSGDRGQQRLRCAACRVPARLLCELLCWRRHHDCRRRAQRAALRRAAQDPGQTRVARSLVGCRAERRIRDGRQPDDRPVETGSGQPLRSRHCASAGSRQHGQRRVGRRRDRDLAPGQQHARRRRRREPERRGGSRPCGPRGRRRCCMGHGATVVVLEVDRRARTAGARGARAARRRRKGARRGVGALPGSPRRLVRRGQRSRRPVRHHRGTARPVRRAGQLGAVHLAERGFSLCDLGRRSGGDQHQRSARHRRRRHQRLRGSSRFRSRRQLQRRRPDISLVGCGPAPQGSVRRGGQLREELSRCARSATGSAATRATRRHVAARPARPRRPVSLRGDFRRHPRGRSAEPRRSRGDFRALRRGARGSRCRLLLAAVLHAASEPACARLLRPRLQPGLDRRHVSSAPWAGHLRSVRQR